MYRIKTRGSSVMTEFKRYRYPYWKNASVQTKYTNGLCCPLLLQWHPLLPPIPAQKSRICYRKYALYWRRTDGWNFNQTREWQFAIQRTYSTSSGQCQTCSEVIASQGDCLKNDSQFRSDAWRCTNMAPLRGENSFFFFLSFYEYFFFIFSVNMFVFVGGWIHLGFSFICFVEDRFSLLISNDCCWNDWFWQFFFSLFFFFTPAFASS